MLKNVLISFFIGLSIMCFAFSAVQPYESMLTSSVSLFNGGAAGSGVIIDDNVVATAAHVVKYFLDKNGKEFKIRLYDGTLVDCNDYYIDEEADVAFLFTEMEEESIADFGDSDVAKVGDSIFIVGNPFGDLEFSMTDGIISHPSREFMVFDDLFQVTAPVSFGSSGGPMYDKRGKLLGIVTGFRGISGFTAVTKVEYIKEAYEKAKKGRS